MIEVCDVILFASGKITMAAVLKPHCLLDSFGVSRFRLSGGLEVLGSTAER
jgi:hypothetical protein